ncbi:hypothetical protein EV426DRAFT_143159 [Tirmania nivea]|nr:hypothetical protein EV426DRAFT_143159 [Tirmania nivea]
MSVMHLGHQQLLTAIQHAPTYAISHTPSVDGIDAELYAHNIQSLKRKVRGQLGLLESHALTQLTLRNLSVSAFNEIQLSLEPHLDRLHIRIDFDSDTGGCIFKCPSAAHEAGLCAWQNLVALLQEIRMPLQLSQKVRWFAGAPDIPLRSLSGKQDSKKTPDLCLRYAGSSTPTIVIETGFSESCVLLRQDARRWLQGTYDPATDTGVQCVILFRIHKVMKQIFQNGYINTAVIDSYKNYRGIDIEIWRNQTIPGTCTPLLSGTTQGNAQKHTTPIMISAGGYSIEAIIEKEIPAWQEFIKTSKETLLHTKGHRDSAPIPRGVSQKESMDYITIYLEDIVSPANVPAARWETKYANIPIQLFLRGYLSTLDLELHHGREPQDNDTIVEEDAWAAFDMDEEALGISHDDSDKGSSDEGHEGAPTVLA